MKAILIGLLFVATTANAALPNLPDGPKLPDSPRLPQPQRLPGLPSPPDLPGTPHAEYPRQGGGSTERQHEKHHGKRSHNPGHGGHGSEDVAPANRHPTNGFGNGGPHGRGK